MKNISRSVLFVMFLLSSTAAQDGPTGRVPPQNSTDAYVRFTRELILRQLETDRDQVTAEIAKRREAQNREKQFVNKVNKFVGTWSRFARLYNERKAFDIKTAKEVSKAFHELERSGDWPVLDKK